MILLVVFQWSFFIPRQTRHKIHCFHGKTRILFRHIFASLGKDTGLSSFLLKRNGFKEFRKARTWSQFLENPDLKAKGEQVFILHGEQLMYRSLKTIGQGSGTGPPSVKKKPTQERNLKYHTAQGTLTLHCKIGYLYFVRSRNCRERL